MNSPKLKQRKDLEKKFTEFLTVKTDTNNTLTWKRDSDIHKDIAKYKQDYLEKKQDKASDVEFDNSIKEDDFAKYLLSQLNEANEPLKKVEQYLNAYLQEACYWAVKKHSDKDPNFNFNEHLVEIQSYLCETKKLLKNYDKDRGVSLFGYGQMLCERKLEDIIKKETGNVDYRSDWSLLFHVASKSGFKKAFIAERKAVIEIEQYLLLDKCHSKIANELRSKTKDNTVKLTVKDLEKLRNEYNKQRLSKKLKHPGEKLDLNALKERLSLCIKIERAVLVWLCFKEAYKNWEIYQRYQESNASNKGNMPEPDARLYQEIANLYNQRRSRLKYIDSATEAEKVKQVLFACIRSLRLYRNPEDPINRENSSQASNSQSEQSKEIASSFDVVKRAKEQRTSGDLLDRHWHREEKLKFRKLVSKAFVDLVKEYQILFKLSDGLGLDQKSIALILFNKPKDQFKISRNLKRAKRLFFEHTINLYQDNLRSEIANDINNSVERLVKRLEKKGLNEHYLILLKLSVAKFCQTELPKVELHSDKLKIEIKNNLNNLVKQLNQQIQDYFKKYCSTYLELPISKHYRNQLSESDKAICREHYQLEWENTRRQDSKSKKYWRNSLSDKDYQEILERNQVNVEQLSKIQSQLSNVLNNYLVATIQDLVNIDTKKTLKFTEEHKQHINNIQLDLIEEKIHSFVDYWICHKSVRH